MELAIALLYATIAVITWRTIARLLPSPWRLPASVLWPMTLVAAVGGGLLVLPLAVLALMGHAISWYRYARIWLPRTRAVAWFTRAVANRGGSAVSPNTTAGEGADVRAASVSLS